MNTRSLRQFVSAVAFGVFLINPCAAEDWGAYRIVSASAPEFVLEAVGGVKAGAIVSIQKPNGTANQKWIVIPADGSMRIAPAQDPSLVLSVEQGGNKNGTLIVLEKDRGEAFQRWSSTRTAAIRSSRSMHRNKGSITSAGNASPGRGSIFGLTPPMTSICSGSSNRSREAALSRRRPRTRRSISHLRSSPKTSGPA